MSAPEDHSNGGVAVLQDGDCGVGDILNGKYRIDGLLAEGGMAVVFRATHLELHSTVAIKLIRPDFAANEALVQRLLSEARVVASLRSKHVNRVLDVGRTERGAPFLVLEYLSGSDVACHLVRHGKLPYVHAVDCVLQACEGLAEAHALGIIHRDLKPENLFLSEETDGSLLVRVLDFGISKGPVGREVRERAHTMAGTVLGTPDYMSPEQARGDEVIDARSDIWALGVVLHELCTGQVPFQGDSLPKLFAKVLGPDWEPSACADKSLPLGLLQVIARCLRKDPNQRYQSVVELTRALSHFGSDPARAVSVARVAANVTARSAARDRLALREDAPTPLTMISSTPSSQLELAGRRRRRVVGSAAAALALSALTLGAASFGEEPPATSHSAAAATMVPIAAASKATLPEENVSVPPEVEERAPAPRTTAAPRSTPPGRAKPRVAQRTAAPLAASALPSASADGVVNVHTVSSHAVAPPPVSTTNAWDRKSFGGRR